MGVQGALLKLHRVEHASHSQPNLNPMLHPKPGHRQALLYEADGPSRTVLTRPAPHVTAYIRPQSFDSPRLSSTALCYREPVSVNTERTTDRDYLDFLKISLSPRVRQLPACVQPLTTTSLPLVQEWPSIPSSVLQEKQAAPTQGVSFVLKDKRRLVSIIL